MIGLWDNTNCAVALLPASLGIGSAPAAFNTGNFPIYRGPVASGDETAAFANYLGGDGYSDGEILFSSGSTSNIALTNYVTYANTTSDCTIALWHREYPAQATYAIALVWSFEGASFATCEQAIGRISLDHNPVVNLYSVGGGFDSRLGTRPPTSGTAENMTIGENYLSVFTKDGTTLGLYVFSTAYDSGFKYFTGTLPTMSDTNPVLNVGNNPSYAFYPAGPNVRMKSLIVYDKALSFSEAQSLYNLGPNLGLQAYDTNGVVTLIPVSTSTKKPIKPSVKGSSKIEDTNGRWKAAINRFLDHHNINRYDGAAENRIRGRSRRILSER